jgi:hypothetical protein
MGMPEYPWNPVSSYLVPVSPPSAGPASGTLVQLPCINQDWLPFVQGALDQLRNPTAWPPALTDSQRNDVLDNVDELRSMFAVINVPCCNVTMRLTDACGLQFSTDGGSTWTDVTGWNANFQSCVQAAVPITGAPPNPGGLAPDALVCSIAGYSVDDIIQGSMQKAIDAVNLNKSLLQYALDVVLVLPGFEWTAVFIDAVGFIYGAITQSNVNDFEAAMTNATLWSDVQCAIYNAIVVAGHLTLANFPTVLSNISAITSAPADVVDAIHDFLSALGFVGLAQLQQPAGLSSNDCVPCGGPSMNWCKDFYFPHGQFGWTLVAGNPGAYTPTVGFTTTPAGGHHQMVVELNFPAQQLTSISFTHANDSNCGGVAAYGQVGGSTVETFVLTGGGGTFTDVRTPTVPYDSILFVMDCSVSGAFVFSQARLHGTGVNPFGASNC